MSTQTSQTEDHVSEEGPLQLGPRLVDDAARAGLTVRLIGGVAVALHSPVAAHPPFARTYEDVDLVVGSKDRKGLDEVFLAAGYVPDVAFNQIHGRERRCYDRPDGSSKLDVFIGEFTMCHTLPLDGRLAVDERTVPLADLVLSKTQIFELNDKDAYDVLAVLHDHELGPDDDDRISVPRLQELTGADWGLWRTTMRSLDRLDTVIGTIELDVAAKARLSERVAELRTVLQEAPKSRKWKMRDKVGDRVKWYTLPEDPDRNA
jgi:hypothetical protein